MPVLPIPYKTQKKKQIAKSKEILNKFKKKKEKQAQTILKIWDALKRLNL